MKYPEPMELCLCESRLLVLRLNHPYIFIEGADCPECKKMADNAREAYGPSGGAPIPSGPCDEWKYDE